MKIDKNSVSQLISAKTEKLGKEIDSNDIPYRATIDLLHKYHKTNPEESALAIRTIRDAIEYLNKKT